MKTKLRLVLAGLFLLSQAGTVWAQQTSPANFIVQATVPGSTGITVTVTKEPAPNSGGSAVVEPNGFNALGFDPLTFNTTNQIYTTDHFWMIDFTTNGSTAAHLKMAYAETVNPNNSDVGGSTPSGLGYKGNVTVVKTTGSGTSTTDNPIANLTLIGANGKDYPSSTFTGGWARLYVGLNTGASTDPQGQGAQAFNAKDATGQYQGQLSVTYTLT